MTEISNEQAKRLNKNGYKVIRLKKSFVLVRNYSINCKSIFKKHITFYKLKKLKCGTGESKNVQNEINRKKSEAFFVIISDWFLLLILKSEIISLNF